jgi:PAS domain S-box-containing protein
MRLQTAPCGHVAFDDERQIVSINDEALRQLGYEREELVGQSLSKLLPPAVRILFHANIFPLLAELGRAEEVYAILRCRAGDDLPVLLNAARTAEGSGFVTNCVFLAVKRRALFERHLERLVAARDAQKERDKATSSNRDVASQELSERLSTLGLLLAGIMHEVRNPLTYVQGNLELLEDELAVSEDAPIDRHAARESLSEARQGVARIRDLVGAVSLVSRTSGAEPVPVDTAQVVDTALKLVRHRLIGCAKVDVEGPRPGAFAAGDAARLVQVVVNLLVNAGQALNESRSRDARIVLRNFVSNEKAVIEVSDNGPGVPQATKARIFEPFYTSKPVGEGTGLGLTISRQIVASLGGRLGLYDSAEGGATFRIELPLPCTSGG